MTQTGKSIFIAIIFAFVIVWGMIIILGIPKEQRKQKQKRYDESQIFEQCRGCKYAFFSMIVYLTVYGILDDQGIVWCQPLFGVAFGIILSLGIYLSHCILQDAYFAISEGKLSVLIPANVVALLNLNYGFEYITKGTVIENGLITADGLHFLLVGLILCLDLTVFLRKRLDKRS